MPPNLRRMVSIPTGNVPSSCRIRSDRQTADSRQLDRWRCVPLALVSLYQRMGDIFHMLAYASTIRYTTLEKTSLAAYHYFNETSRWNVRVVVAWRSVFLSRGCPWCCRVDVRVIIAWISVLLSRGCPCCCRVDVRVIIAWMSVLLSRGCTRCCHVDARVFVT